MIARRCESEVIDIAEMRQRSIEVLVEVRDSTANIIKIKDEA